MNEEQHYQSIGVPSASSKNPSFGYKCTQG
jgi:hypothetical protein